MNLDRLNQRLTLVANLGVIAGILFLAVEINQNTKATMASSSEALTEQSLQYFSMGLDNQVIARALHKQDIGAELDGFERAQLQQHQFFNFRVFENAYLQYLRGYYEEREWQRYRRIITVRLRSDPSAIAMWQDQRGTWTTEFEAEVDRLVSVPQD